MGLYNRVLDYESEEIIKQDDLCYDYASIQNQFVSYSFRSVYWKPVIWTTIIILITVGNNSMGQNNECSRASMF